MVEMKQCYFNVGDVILLSLFLTLRLSTVAVLANQLQPEKNEY